MPIINGQKMACAPCIRGHRSTKCNHFYERVMIPVRKPGRPLSTCPCPPGRPCACGGVRVAIPKKQKCGCPTEASGEAGKKEKEPAPAETPMSPSKPSYRVGKPNGNSRANSRKQSFDPTALDRMDPSSINLITTPVNKGPNSGMGATGSPSVQSAQADLNGFGSNLGVLPAGASNTYASPQQPTFAPHMQYNMGFQYAPTHQLQHGIKMEDGLYANGGFGAVMPPPPLADGHHGMSSLGHPAQATMPAPKTNGAASGSSSYGGKAPTPPPASTDAQVPQQEYGQPYTTQPPAVNGCCGSKAPTPPSASGDVQAPRQDYGQPYPPQTPAVNSCCASKAQKTVPAAAHGATPHQVFGQSYMPQFQYPTVFRYPGDYGSWQHPIDPMIWQQVMSQTSMPLNTPMSPAPNAEAADMGASHQCSCGEGCQCVGCLAHPFNAQMFQYVNNAYSGSNTGSPAADATAGTQTQTAAAGGRDSPAEAPTPAVSEGSPPREEQSLSSLDYFFVNLPISGLCGGNLELCPCGDSCDCPGCLVHQIPLNQG